MARAENTELIDAFKEFYRNYYRNEIGELAKNYPDEQKSLKIDWKDLFQFAPDLAQDLQAKPEAITDYAEEALRLYDLPIDVKLGQAHVRVKNLQETTRIGNIRADHHETLVSIPGTIRSTSSIISHPQTAAFECQRCGMLTRIPQSIPVGEQSLNEPHECQGCERDGPFRINDSQTEYVDVRRFRVESNLADQTAESPESVIAVAKDDIVDKAQPGDTVQVTGIVRVVEFGRKRPQLDATVNDKYVEVSSIDEFESGDLLDITDSDKKSIINRSNKSNLFNDIVESIAPYVPGCEQVKLAVALQLFSGVKKRLPDDTVIPGTIHIGLVADPGMFAAEIVDYAARLAPKSVRVNGTDTTQVGLTTAAYKSSTGTKNWELDAGALVLADGGIACLTRTDNLATEARAALNSVMRDQEVKASKGTATQTLPAETAVLASMNPKYGQFDQFEPIGQQIELEPALISQFDLLFTITDQPNEKKDTDRATQILQTNYAGEVRTHQEKSRVSNYSEKEIASVTDKAAPTIEPELLRKYIAYAKRNCFPTLTEDAKTAIEEFYVDLRAEGQDENAPIPVTARKVEALVRLAEASARIRLSDTIEESDANRVIDLVRSCLEDLGVDPDTGEFDADVIETGSAKDQHERIQNVKSIINDVESDYEEGAPVDIIIERAETVGIEQSKAEHEIEQLKQKGKVYEPRTDHLRTS